VGLTKQEAGDLFILHVEHYCCWSQLVKPKSLQQG